VGPRLRRAAQQKTEEYFQTHLKGDVEISGFRVESLFPMVRASVGDVVVRGKGPADYPPLIEIRQVTFRANTLGLLGRHPTVRGVKIEGMTISIPPRPKDAKPMIHGTDQDLAAKYPVIVEDVHADNVKLVIYPRDLDKAPKEWDLHHLELGPFGFDRPAHFEAMLTNPLPKGEIHTEGSFGPWDADDPRETPVDGKYTFENADMGTLKGLSGIMASTGTFKGPLDYLDVRGETEIPNFSLRTSHHPLALHTDYVAIVDGTNGDTILKDVVAKFLNTTLDVKGEVVDRTKQKGRTIVLDAVSENARVEDLLAMAVGTTPPLMTGAAYLKTQIHIGEGDVDLLQKMWLSGDFSVSDGQFTQAQTEQKIAKLSLKSQGKPEQAEQAQQGDPVTQLTGSFRVAKGVVTFSRLHFGVEGATVTLAGTYDLDKGDVDFRGKLRMDAKLSETTTGVKSFFLKAIDPFFKGKDGGTELPIKITGTKDHPQFGLDLHDKENRE